MMILYLIAAVQATLDIDALFLKINRHTSPPGALEPKIQLGHFLNGGEDHDGIVYDETGVDGLDEPEAP